MGMRPVEDSDDIDDVINSIGKSPFLDIPHEVGDVLDVACTWTCMDMYVNMHAYMHGRMYGHWTCMDMYVNLGWQDSPILTEYAGLLHTLKSKMRCL